MRRNVIIYQIFKSILKRLPAFSIENIQKLIVENALIKCGHVRSRLM